MEAASVESADLLDVLRTIASAVSVLAAKDVASPARTTDRNSQPTLISQDAEFALPQPIARRVLLRNGQVQTTRRAGGARGTLHSFAGRFPADHIAPDTSAQSTVSRIHKRWHEAIDRGEDVMTALAALRSASAIPDSVIVEALEGEKDCPPELVVLWGSACWREHGELHRGEDLPAHIIFGAGEFWYFNGVRHRDEDRPACIAFSPAGEIVCEWWRHGVRYIPPASVRESARALIEQSKDAILRQHAAIQEQTWEMEASREMIANSFLQDP